ncbi:unnamed protein product [Penicillium camemberti]|uniref:Str. FM013 n=1 Tax=Penicillium camemberti (strain FM 013) TaxID=1429867 RepID=A0A0G4PYG4_PENC3|nr:unnamed protein product [Penicillium camemberti]
MSSTRGDTTAILGKVRRCSKNGSLDDFLPMYGLTEDIPVTEVIDASPGKLCYGY